MPEKILDFHTHLGNDMDSSCYTIKQLMESMSEAGVTDAVVFPFDEREIDVETASLALLEGMKEHPNLYPFLRFDPQKMTPERLAESLSQFYGVKLHPKSQDFDPLDRRYFPLYDIISSTGKPLLFHTRIESGPGSNNYSDPNRIITLAEEFPDLVLVIGHFGDFSPGLIETMKHHQNVYLETSLGRSSPHNIKYTVRKVGAQRILFGSDIPYGDQLIERLNVERSKLSDEDKRDVLYNNGARLLGI